MNNLPWLPRREVRPQRPVIECSRHAPRGEAPSVALPEAPGHAERGGYFDGRVIIKANSRRSSAPSHSRRRNELARRQRARRAKLARSGSAEKMESPRGSGIFLPRRGRQRFRNRARRGKCGLPLSIAAGMRRNRKIFDRRDVKNCDLGGSFKRGGILRGGRSDNQRASPDHYKIGMIYIVTFSVACSNPNRRKRLAPYASANVIGG
jgi:hypothetical protein